MQINIYKITTIILTIIIYLFFKPLLIILYPGVLYFFYNDLKKDFFTNFAYCISLSISYWVVSFWMLKYLPLSLSSLINISVLLSIFLILIKEKKSFIAPPIPKKDVLSIFSILFILFTFIPIYKANFMPAGVDTATHTYIARLIYEMNTFPKSYEPIAPFDNFGGSPIGLSVLIAFITKLDSTIPIYKSGLIIALFTYTFIGLGLFLFLKRWFNLYVSFLAVFSVIRFGPDLLRYSLWGGIPAIFSLGLLLFLINYIIDIINQNKFTFLNAANVAILAYAGFSVHHIPTVVLLYVVPVFVLIKFKLLRKRINRTHFYFMFWVFIIILPLAIPFLTSLNPPSEEIINYIKVRQKNYQDFIYTINFYNAPYNIPVFIEKRLGHVIFYTSFMGILLSFLNNKYRKNLRIELSMYSLIILFVFVLNAGFWFLPLSAFLYPDRVITLAIIPISIFVATFYDFLFKSLILPAFRKPFIATSLVFSFAILIYAIFLFSDYQNWYSSRFSGYVSVSSDDLKAFEWIQKNTSPTDVIANNYGDAGVWIPTFTYRKITTYDGMLYDIEDIRKGASKLKPTYLFIGSKPDGYNIIYTTEEIAKNPNYEIVFASGDTRLFKINNR